MKKRILILLGLGIILATLSYRYVYKSHRNIAAEKEFTTISSIKIQEEFISDAKSSTEKYLDKVVVIRGVVSKIDQTYVILDESVFCQFDDSLENYAKVKDSMTIKGRLIGYDDLLSTIKLDQCSIIKESAL